MAERVTVRDISHDEGQRLLRMVRRSAGSVVTWRRAQMVLLSVQGMDVAGIAKGGRTREGLSSQVDLMRQTGVLPPPGRRLSSLVLTQDRLRQ